MTETNTTNNEPITPGTTKPTLAKQVYKPESLLKKRIRKFKSIKRGYYSFIILLVLYFLSFFSPLLMNYKALVVKYNGELLFPILKFYQGKSFDQDVYGEANYRALQEQFELEGGENWVIMPVYPFGPNESLLDSRSEPPNDPSPQHWFGTDDRGRDVFVRLVYGFNVSITFAICVVFFSYLVGASIGASLGYYGGKWDIFAQRFIEIWSAIPYLYTIIIISSLVQPNFIMLVGILMLFGWMGQTYYIRGEFYREKSKDYVQAAIAMGANDFSIAFKHILPNALTPIITFAPFATVGAIGSLVGLDFLGFGLPPPAPSWGELIRQGMGNIFSWWLVLFPFSGLFITLLLVVFIGEAVRQAFDPREFSRLR
ncbi:ABC transporter permease [Calditrichota bacterium]